MKKVKLLIGIFVFFFVFSACEKDALEVFDNAPELKAGNNGNDKVTGFDQWGFNWNAHEFHGYAINMLLGDHYFIGWPHYQQYVYEGNGMDFWEMLVSNYDYFPFLIPVELLDSRLVCKWNDNLINKDGEYPLNGWIDSDAWIVFNYSGKVGKENWSSTRKLVAAKSSDELIDGIWYNDAGTQIGIQSIFWSDLIIVQVTNIGDVPPFPFFYFNYKSPMGPGLGKYKSK